MRFLFAWQHVDAVEPAHRRRRTAIGDRHAGRIRAGGVGVGTRGAAGARGPLRTVDAGHAVPGRRCRMGATFGPDADRGRSGRSAGRHDADRAVSSRARRCLADLATHRRRPRPGDCRRPARARSRATKKRLPTPFSSALGAAAGKVLAALRARGASFLRELAAACAMDDADAAAALGELVAAGLVTSDGFAGLRAIVRASAGRLASSRWPGELGGPVVAAAPRRPWHAARAGGRGPGVGVVAAIRCGLPPAAHARGQCRAVA